MAGLDRSRLEVGTDRWAVLSSCEYRDQGETNQPLQLQRCQDLKAWIDWMNVTGTGNRQEIVDPGAGSQARKFYRGGGAVKNRQRAE